MADEPETTGTPEEVGNAEETQTTEKPTEVGNAEGSAEVESLRAQLAQAHAEKSTLEEMKRRVAEYESQRLAQPPSTSGSQLAAEMQNLRRVAYDPNEASENRIAASMMLVDKLGVAIGEVHQSAQDRIAEIDELSDVPREDRKAVKAERDKARNRGEPVSVGSIYNAILLKRENDDLRKKLEMANKPKASPGTGPITGGGRQAVTIETKSMKRSEYLGLYEKDPAKFAEAMHAQDKGTLTIVPG